MIISASRRTDIPALYGEWFENRVREGFVLVRHPRNYRRYSKIWLDGADCVVFWTKNPADFLSAAERINKKLPCAFQYTLNAYGEDVEPGLPALKERTAMFEALARMLGTGCVVWRYDPVLLTERYGEAFHREAFSALCKRLEGLTDRCVISFLDIYASVKKRIVDSGIIAPTEDKARGLAGFFAETAALHGIRVTSCAEPYDLSAQGVFSAGCIGGDLIAAACGKQPQKKDAGQRELCLCAASSDIGEYDSCVNACVYCYATASRTRAAKIYRAHDPKAPCISGYPPEDAEIFERER